MMFKVVTCLFIYHDLRLVALAAALCGLSCFAAVMLLRRAMATQGTAHLTWLVTAGAAGRFGIWATSIRSGRGRTSAGSPRSLPAPGRFHTDPKRLSF